VLAEELLVTGGDSPQFHPIRPLLDAALRLNQRDPSYSWHGWSKPQIQSFLDTLPTRCSIIVGVWETHPAQGQEPAAERLALGCILEIIENEVHAVRTFDTLTTAGLKPVDRLEAGIDDALEIQRLVRDLIAPVAWALFIEKTAWDEWFFAESDNSSVIDKGEVLAEMARQGRCVLMGSQVAHPHHPQ